jgi:hypothetical protein
MPSVGFHHRMAVEAYHMSSTCEAFVVLTTRDEPRGTRKYWESAVRDTRALEDEIKNRGDDDAAS